jgi:hypothetical protein
MVTVLKHIYSKPSYSSHIIYCVQFWKLISFLLQDLSSVLVLIWQFFVVHTKLHKNGIYTEVD